MSGPSGSVRCQECGKPLSSKRSLARHLADVHGVKPKYSCPHCGLEAESSRLLREHVTEFHGQARRHRCETCGRMFARRRHLTQHVANVHQGRRDFECTVCDQTFTQRGHLHEHVRRRHPGELASCGGVVRSLTRRRSEMNGQGTAQSAISADSESDDPGAHSSRSAQGWAASASASAPVLPIASLAMAPPSGLVHVPHVGQWNAHGPAPVPFQASLGGHPGVPPPPPMSASSLVPPVASLGRRNDSSTARLGHYHAPVGLAPAVLGPAALAPAGRGWASTPAAAAALPRHVQAHHFPVMPQPAARPFAVAGTTAGYGSDGRVGGTGPPRGFVSMGVKHSTPYDAGQPGPHPAAPGGVYGPGSEPQQLPAPRSEDDGDDTDGRHGPDAPIRLPKSGSTAQRFSLHRVSHLVEPPAGTVPNPDYMARSGGAGPAPPHPGGGGEPTGGGTRGMGLWLRGGAAASVQPGAAQPDGRGGDAAFNPGAVVAAHPWLSGHSHPGDAQARPALHDGRNGHRAQPPGRTAGDARPPVAAQGSPYAPPSVDASAPPAAHLAAGHPRTSVFGAASLTARHPGQAAPRHADNGYHHHPRPRAGGPAGFAPYAHQRQQLQPFTPMQAASAAQQAALPYHFAPAPMPVPAAAPLPYPPAGPPYPALAHGRPYGAHDPATAPPGRLPPSAPREESTASDIAVVPAQPAQWRLGPTLPYIDTGAALTASASAGFVQGQLPMASSALQPVISSASADVGRPVASESAEDTRTTGEASAPANDADSGKPSSGRHSSPCEDDKAFSNTSRSGVSNEALLSTKNALQGASLGKVLAQDSPAVRAVSRTES